MLAGTYVTNSTRVQSKANLAYFQCIDSQRECVRVISVREDDEEDACAALISARIDRMHLLMMTMNTREHISDNLQKKSVRTVAGVPSFGGRLTRRIRAYQTRVKNVIMLKVSNSSEIKHQTPA